MALTTWADVDPRAVRMTVYYEGSSTLYEGSPVCYNWDTTINWSGVDRADGTESTTTTEGSQNEGRWIRVEDPATANLGHFAGVVAKGSGNIATGAAGVIDIYIPNGAMVPVRTDANCTVGQTVLAIANGQVLLQSGGRNVAIAQETINRTSPNGLVLAILDDTLFAYQKNGSNNLLLTSTSAQKLNDIRCDFAHTSGYATNTFVYTTLSGTIAATGGGASVLAYLSIDGSVTATTGYFRSVLAQMNLSGTLNGSNLHITGLMAQLSGTPTFTACSKVAGLMVDCSLGVAPTSGDYVGIMISNNGLNQTEVNSAIEIYGNYGINELFSFQSCAGITANFISNGGTGGAAKTITSGGDWKKIKIDIDGTDYYMLAMVNPSEV